MPTTLTQLERQFEQALISCLAEVPFVRPGALKWRTPALGQPPEWSATLKLTGGGQQALLIALEANGQPKPARAAINQLLLRLRAQPEAYGVLAAPYISPRTAAICAEAGVGYLDLAGNCRLVFQQVYIARQGQAPARQQRRELRTLFSPRAARVVRVLLAEAGQAWKVTALAEAAEVSLGQVSNVKRRLAEREWIESGPDGLRLRAPEALLAEWSQYYTYQRNQVRDYYTLQPLGRIESLLAQTCARIGLRCALTGFSAATRLAPAVRNQRVMAYVDGDPELLAGELGLKPVTSGANVSLFAPYDAGVFYGVQLSTDGLPLATPAQVYLDLHGYPGRGDEAAQAVLQEVLRPQW